MARELALSILTDILQNDAYADLAVKKALAKSACNGRDKALATSIAYGTIQHIRFIDYQLMDASVRTIDTLSPKVLNILRLTVYQLRFLDRIPMSAAVNEAVKLTKKYAYSGASFVNGVLRRVLRTGWLLPEEEKDRLAIQYSYPDWLVELWLSMFGHDECEKLLEAGNARPPLSVRVNQLKVFPEEVACLCKAHETAVEEGLHIDEPSNIADTDMFRSGWITVQDVGAQMASLKLAPKPGECVLDVCAAPGGKTTHMAELMDNRGKIVAWDMHAHKIKLIEENAKRLGISIIEAAMHDSRILDSAHCMQYDKVMVDAPCSGLGIIRKKPDIKWKRKPEDIDALCASQAQILDVSAQYVKKGGMLLYCTCTINSRENEEIVNAFLKNHTEFSLAEPYTQLLPHMDNTDGFFFAKLRRKRV